MLADLDQGAVRAILARHDNLPPEVTGSMAMPSSFPVGPVAEANIQRVASAMLEFGVLSPRAAAGVRQGTLVRSMISPG